MHSHEKDSYWKPCSESLVVTTCDRAHIRDSLRAVVSTKGTQKTTRKSSANGRKCSGKVLSGKLQTLAAIGLQLESVDST
jgi:hypothetical protein